MPHGIPDGASHFCILYIVHLADYWFVGLVRAICSVIYISNVTARWMRQSLIHIEGMSQTAALRLLVVGTLEYTDGRISSIVRNDISNSIQDQLGYWRLGSSIQMLLRATQRYKMLEQAGGGD